MNKKVEVGEFCCLIDDTEVGCNPYSMDCPSKDIKHEISCKHQNHSYDALKCDYEGNGGHCDFAQEVTNLDLIEYPSLFKECKEI